MDETFKALKAMCAHDSKAVKFVAYHLKDATHAWFEIWESEHATASPAPTQAEFEDAFVERFLFKEARFKLATKFEQLEQDIMTVHEYSLQSTYLARYSMYMNSY